MGDALVSQRCAMRVLTYRVHRPSVRSEEHTSELQSRRDLVCRLLLEKKNQDILASTRVRANPNASRGTRVLTAGHGSILTSTVLTPKHLATPALAPVTKSRYNVTLPG